MVLLRLRALRALRRTLRHRRRMLQRLRLQRTWRHSPSRGRPRSPYSVLKRRGRRGPHRPQMPHRHQVRNAHCLRPLRSAYGNPVLNFVAVGTKGRPSKIRKHTDAIEGLGNVLEKCNGFFPRDATHGNGMDAAEALHTYLTVPPHECTSEVQFYWTCRYLPNTEEVKSALISLPLNTLKELFGFLHMQKNVSTVVQWLKQNKKLASISRTLLVNFILDGDSCGDTYTVMQETLATMNCPLEFENSYDPHCLRHPAAPHKDKVNMNITRVLKDLSSKPLYDEPPEEPLFWARSTSPSVRTYEDYSSEDAVYNPYVPAACRTSNLLENTSPSYPPTSPSYCPTWSPHNPLYSPTTPN